MAHFFKPSDESLRGYNLDRVHAPDSVGSIEVKVGGTKRVGLWGGTDLTKVVKDITILDRAIAISQIANDTEILTVKGISLGKTVIETFLGPRKSASLTVNVVKDETEPEFSLLIGINQGVLTFFGGAVDAARDPGHTIVALKDRAGRFEKIFSYGPAIRDALACSGPGKGGYHLLAKDVYKMYEFPINKDQHDKALAKMKAIEDNPGIFDVNHQCTTTSLEVVAAASVIVPNGTGDIDIPICNDGKGVPAPFYLDQALEKKFIAEKRPITVMLGRSFQGLNLVEVK